MTVPPSLNAMNFIEHEGYSNWFEMEGHPTLYYCCFQKEHYSDYLFDHFSIEFPDRLKNAVVKRRAEFLVGRYCASKALERHGINHFTIEIGKHRNPLWPESICGAISHCDNYAVAVVDRPSQSRGIGIDIEELVSRETAERLVPQIIYGSESQLFSNHNNMELLFTLAFSVKESFFKAAYPSVQRYFNFDAVSVKDIDFEKKILILETNYELSVDFQKGRKLKGHFSYISPTKLVTLVKL